MKKIGFLIISVIIGILVSRKSDEIIIPSDAIRIRIIANSNDISDLSFKNKLKNEIKDNLFNYVKDASSSIDADDKIANNLNNIKEFISQKTDDYKINYGSNYFPRKIYKGVVYPAGEYKSLVITLGSGLGDNWWCVLYPPLCMIDDSNTTDVEYRFLVQDFLKN